MLIIGSVNISFLDINVIGNIVTIIVDRKLGSHHLDYENICYSLNYGYVSGVMASDGEEQDAYILGVNVPVDKFTGKIVAIIHRKNDVEDKWVVAPENMVFTKEEIINQTYFQEQYFNSVVYT